MKKEESFGELKGLIKKEVKIIGEIVNIHRSAKSSRTPDVKKMADGQIAALKKTLKMTTDEISGILEDMTLTKPLPKTKISIPSKTIIDKPLKTTQKKKTPYDEYAKTKRHKIVDVDLTALERKTLKRIKKKKKKVERKKEAKASKYVGFSNRFFEKYARKLAKTEIFMSLERDIIKANLKYVISSYVSMILMTCAISVFVGIFLMIFFFFFNVSSEFPIVTLAREAFGTRFVKVFWIPFAAPLVTFLSMYVYPSVEKSYLENKINQELPFATIHLSAIAGSMLEPSKMFNIIIATKEYPFLEREFTKIINEINVYGYDLVTALRNVAANSPSTRLTELLNGIATTINSGGGLPEFFEKRAQTLLFEYQIERERYTKSAETFMDIYISLVIAAPMILMLLLMMMKISNLGISLSSSAITLLMIMGVTIINIIFLVFLQLKQPTA